MTDQHRTTAETLNAVRGALNALVAAAETLAAASLALAQHAGDVVVPQQFAPGVEAVTRSALGDIERLEPTQARALGSLARAMLAQAAAFASDPQEPAGWAVTDPVVLQSLGQASASLTDGICDAVVPRYPGLAERLAGPGAAVLDVGTGVGALALAFARRYPAARVVGLDVWQPSLAIAAANVAASGLGDRVELRLQDVNDLDEDEAYDLVFFAGPFIPGSIQPTALARVARACRPGGIVVYGTFGGPDPLAAALADLRIARSGGPVISDDDIAEMLRGVGLTKIEQVGTDIGLPARLVAGVRT